MHSTRVYYGDTRDALYDEWRSIIRDTAPVAPNLRVVPATGAPLLRTPRTAQLELVPAA
jgi:hypothetical protein